MLVYHKQFIIHCARYEHKSIFITSIRVEEIWDVRERLGRCEVGTDQMYNAWKEDDNEINSYLSEVRTYD